MLKKIITTALISLLCLGALAAPSFALEAEKQPEFDRIMSLKMADLTEEAWELMDRLHPDEDWDEQDFPSFVFTNRSVEIGYMIAVKHPEVLTINTCYCFCDAMGHRSLLNCFIKEKKPLFGSRFDSHGADCNICYGQAMMALLTKELGASDEEIQAGMAKKFGKLIKLKEEGKLAPPQ